MSKGNMFVSTAKGRVGNLVLYARKGSQITRAYQGNVANPRTNAQMLQRAKFANAVKFYQKAVQHFFKFAFQDQKSNETAFNAFMRHNIGNSALLLKDAVSNAYFPALGRWVLSSGSLAAVAIPKFSAGVVSMLNTSIEVSDATIGALSSKLIAQGFNAGDIVTLVFISSLVTSVDFDLSKYYDSGNLTQPQWDIRQFIIDASDTTKVEDMPRNGANLGALAPAAGGITFTYTHADYCNFAACIVTRKNSGITLASNSELVPNAVALSMLNAADTISWRSSVISSWNAQGDAILHGSVANGENTTTSSGSAGSGSQSGSNTSGTSTSSSITTINGGNLAAEITSAGTTAITIVGTALSLSTPTATGTGISVSDFKVNTDRTQATFNVVVADNYGSGSVSYMGRTVVNVSKSEDTGDDIDA